MTYIARLVERSASGAPTQASLLPAMRSQSPLASFDQRLNLPGLGSVASVGQPGWELEGELGLDDEPSATLPNPAQPAPSAAPIAAPPAFSERASTPVASPALTPALVTSEARRSPALEPLARTAERLPSPSRLVAAVPQILRELPMSLPPRDVPPARPVVEMTSGPRVSVEQQATERAADLRQAHHEAVAAHAEPASAPAYAGALPASLRDALSRVDAWMRQEPPTRPERPELLASPAATRDPAPASKQASAALAEQADSLPASGLSISRIEVEVVKPQQAGAASRTPRNRPVVVSSAPAAFARSSGQRALFGVRQR